MSFFKQFNYGLQLSWFGATLAILIYGLVDRGRNEAIPFLLLGLSMFTGMSQLVVSIIDFLRRRTKSILFRHLGISVLFLTCVSLYGNYMDQHKVDWWLQTREGLALLCLIPVGLIIHFWFVTFTVLNPYKKPMRFIEDL